MKILPLNLNKENADCAIQFYGSAVSYFPLTSMSERISFELILTRVRTSTLQTDSGMLVPLRVFGAFQHRWLKLISSSSRTFLITLNK